MIQKTPSLSVVKLLISTLIALLSVWIKPTKLEKSGPIARYWKKSVRMISVKTMSFSEISFLYYNFRIAFRQYFRQMTRVIMIVSIAMLKQIPKTNIRPDSKVSASSSLNGQFQSSIIRSSGMLEVPSDQIMGA
jgi:hypothetical protein